MSKKLSKKTVINISTYAHMIIGLMLVDLLETLFGKILLLVCVGVIAGTQNMCIRKVYDNVQPPEES